ncbi:MAG: hypothetical protein J3K34DRAFT_436810 [Monoraphidium minutum]|nr:MAG: hypothetical protein J3K34DRAFT_436810 [Monoraphidium minutum]
MQLPMIAPLKGSAGAGAPAASRQQSAGGGGAREGAAEQGPAAALLALLARLPFCLDGRVRGLIMLNIMTVVMSTNWIVIKAAGGGAMTDAATFQFLRFALAAAAFSPFLLRARGPVIKAGLQVGLWYSAGYMAQALALTSTAASRASLLATFTVLAVPLIAGLSGQHIRPVVWACAAAALVGTGMLEGGSSLGPPNVGDAWAVASALFFAFQIIVSERQMHALPPKSELPLMAVSMLTVACLSAASAAALHVHAGDAAAAAAGLEHLFAAWAAAVPEALGGGGAVPPGEAAEAAATAAQLFYTGVVSTDLVLLVELIALQQVSSTDAAMIYSMEPVLGALMAYVFLGERWGPWGWAGGGVIMAASMLTQMAGAVEGGDAAAEGAAGEGGAAAKEE